MYIYKTNMLSCCDNPDIQYHDVDVYICKNCYVVCEELPNIKTQSGYKIIHHLSEVLKRLQCDEPNKPSTEELNQIKYILQNDYSLANIWHKCNRKHTVYIYCQLNGLAPPLITNLEKETIKAVVYKIAEVYPQKLPKYIYIMSRICENMGFLHIQPFLYVHKINPKLDDIIDKYIKVKVYNQ